MKQRIEEEGFMKLCNKIRNHLTTFAIKFDDLDRQGNYLKLLKENRITEILGVFRYNRFIAVQPLSAKQGT